MQRDGLPGEGGHPQEVSRNRQEPVAAREQVYPRPRRPERAYQTQAHDAAWREFDAGVPSTLLVMPTGTGKTWVAANVAATARERGQKTLFLAHREVLVRQACDTLAERGLDVAVEMGEQDARTQVALYGHADVVVGTVQTLQGERLRRWDPAHFGLVITDESHRAAAPSHQAVFRHFNGYPQHLGITATPDGCSGQIGNVYQTLAYHYPIRQAVLDGYLVKPVHEKCKVPINLKNIRTTGGDFCAGELSERISPQAEYIADAIKQRIGDRFCVAFTPDVGSALGLAQALSGRTASGAGLAARYVSGAGGRFGMAKGEQARILRDVAAGNIRCVVCCDLLFEGWDWRECSAVVIARPTRLRYRYAQMVGRGTRICPEIGKTECHIIDFDWQTDSSSRDLMTPIELFAEEDPDFKALDAQSRAKVLKEAKSLLEKGQDDPLAALEEAKDRQKARERLPVYLTGTKAEFEVEISDPLGVSDLVGLDMKKKYDLASAYTELARPYQCAQLESMGVPKPEKLSFYGAARMIKHLKARQEKGLATHEQVRTLIRQGVGPVEARSMSQAQASRTISHLSGEP
jgi:superfamily II DNA or RNA helicase